MVQTTFDQSFWNRGQFPAYITNGTDISKINNPWVSSSNNAAPFDQRESEWSRSASPSSRPAFYLILNVAVGGTNGRFPDNLGGKPWLDSSPTAMRDFWAAKDKWYPTWPQDPKQRGMGVKSVKMWQTC